MYRIRQPTAGVYGTLRPFLICVLSSDGQFRRTCHNIYALKNRFLFAFFSGGQFIWTEICPSEVRKFQNFRYPDQLSVGNSVFPKDSTSIMSEYDEDSTSEEEAPLFSIDTSGDAG
jgi:hypothetical protein